MNIPDVPQARVPLADTSAVGQLLNVVLAAIIVGALYFGREFLVPLTLAVLLAFVLAPVVRLLKRWRLPHAPAVLATVTLALAVVGGAGGLIGSQMASLGQELPRYQGTIQSKIQDVGGLTTGKLAAITGRFGIQAAQAGHQAAKAAGLAKTPARPAAAPVLVQLYRAPLTPLDVGKQFLRPLLTPLATIGLVIVLTLFMLLQQGDLRDRLIRLLGAGDLHRTTVAMNDAAARLSRYFLSQLAVNVAFGTAVGVGLTLIGVPHAILWGAIAALMRFIPYLGGMISLSLAAAMAAAVDPGWSMVAWTIGLFLLIEVVTGQFIEPLLYGHSTGLSPVSVLVAAVFWTWLWGPVGLILSTPLSLCLLVMGRHVPRLAFIEILLGDRPPLTAVESFYQRVLAGDADELLQQAEAALVQGSLAAYYDEVALKGLLLAANDAHRGLLKRDQLVGFKAIVEGLISDLADVADLVGEVGDVTVQPARTPKLVQGRVICVAGPGLLDELGGAMLCQLLNRHEVGTIAVPYRSASGDGMAGLDAAGADLICVFHLSIGRNQTRLQKLVGRLETTTSAPLLVANIASEDAAEWEDRPRARSTSNLAEAVRTCTQMLGAHGAHGGARRRAPRGKPTPRAA